MADQDIALMAHLLRRAGFGASRDEIETRLAQGYEQTVEELLNPEEQPGIEEDLLMRYWPAYEDRNYLDNTQTEWVYRMVNNPRQLQEKMTLFWHTIFCTGESKIDQPSEGMLQIDMFREHGMGNFRDLLFRLSTNPAMLYYLDNTESHKTAINENYGRELLELFSMGAGMDGEINYTEDDVKACSRAFTGWSVAPTLPDFPYGRYPWTFVYDPADHDDGEKTFLGETGRWKGGDVIDIICKQPATARFVSRKLYDFFVADEPPVPAWQQSEPRDIEAIEKLEKAYFDSGYEIKAMLQVLFNSEFFKSEAVRYAKVKSPAEVVAGTLRLVGEHREIKPGLREVAMESRYMGMDLLNPPSVEGWHTGREWIDGGTLLDRTNFASELVGNTELPGVKSIIDRLMSGGERLTSEELVEGCLDLIGPVDVLDSTREELTAHARKGGELRHGTDGERAEFARRVGEMLQMISATAEFQLV